MARSVTVTLANRDGRIFEVDRATGRCSTSLEADGVSLPYGCRYGGCISCAARLLCGRGRSARGASPSTGARSPLGYVLLCVARPLSDCTLDVGVESHDKLYRNPFQSPLRPDELKPDFWPPPLDRRNKRHEPRSGLSGWIIWPGSSRR